MHQSNPPMGTPEPGAIPAEGLRNRLITLATMLLALAYCTTMVVRPPATWPGWIRDLIDAVSGPMYRLAHAIVALLGVEPPQFLHRHAIYLVLVCVLVPWLIMAALGRGRPHDLGFRRPNRYAWRWLALSFVLSLPFLIWMARGSALAAYYVRQYDRAGPTAFFVYYAVNMAAEHFFLQGAILALFRRGRRWPAPPPVDEPSGRGFRRALQWLGLAMPSGDARGVESVMQFLGLSRGCIVPVLGSALLFGVVHIGKDPRELVLSFPGGLVLAVLAYRTNTWITAWVLHLVTAGTTFAIIAIAH